MSHRKLEDEALTLQAVEQPDWLKAPVNDSLKDFARLAAHVCMAPVAVITTIDGYRIAVSAVFGMPMATFPETGDTPWERTASQQNLFEVPDAHLDVKYFRQGIEFGGRVFRSYAGVPLLMRDGTTVGTVSVLDVVSRTLTDNEREALCAVARQTATQIELNLRLQQMEVAAQTHTSTDVTEQRDVEATLRESEARYRELVEGSLGMVCRHDAKGVLLSVNRHGAEAIGRTQEQVAGHCLLEFMIPGNEATFAMYLDGIMASGQAEGLLHLRHVNGELRVIAYRNKLITNDGEDAYILGFGVDVTDKVRTEGELRAVVRQSNSILESIGDGIYGLDLEGRVTVVNPAASQMLGYTPEELLGRSMHELIHHSHADGTAFPWETCPVSQSLRGLETSRVSNQVFWRKDGTSFPVDFVSRPQIESDGKTPGRAVGVVVAFTDATQRYALDRMKDEFIATVSHELRTPLTSLRAALGLLQSGALATKPERARQMLDVAIGNTDRLVRLVNDILDLERMNSGRTELNYKMFGIDELLRKAAEKQKKHAATAEIELTVEAQQVNAWADPDRVTQTLNNLISNAIKFSPRGSRVVFKATRTTAGEIQIEVQDSGFGIPESKLEQIFDRFQRVDSSDTRATGGSGLGLAICRGIVEQHGGRIWATSKPDEGSSFFFTLPSHPLNTPAPSPEG